MSTSPTIGEGVWVEPELDDEPLDRLIDAFQAQTIVREQNIIELTKVCDVLRDTQTKFESNSLTSAEVASILAEYKSDEFKSNHPDTLMHQALLRVIEKFEKTVK
jgi:phage gp16-like protein